MKSKLNIEVTLDTSGAKLITSNIVKFLMQIIMHRLKFEEFQ